MSAAPGSKNKVTMTKQKKKPNQTKAHRSRARDTRPEHAFFCVFAAGAEATPRLPHHPEPGKARGLPDHMERPVAAEADAADYQAWRRSILQDMETIDGRRHGFS